ncbi:MAG TPA: FHA domain-containing protein [Polyangiaceae bacterium]
MITCPKCGKENQDHYKFCLGCGAELPRASAPRPFSPNTPPHGVPHAGAQPVQAAPVATVPPAGSPSAGAIPLDAPVERRSVPPAAPGGKMIECPQCNQQNPANNRFCAACGYNLAALGSVPAPAAAPAAASSGALATVVLTALRADGSEAGTYRLPDAPSLTVGRDTGSIFAGDSYLSPRHATFSRRGAQLFIKDEGSLNGVYMKLRPNEPWPLNYTDVFRIGQEIVRFEDLKVQGRTPDGVDRFGSPSKGYIGRLALVIGRDTTGNAFPVPERGVHCGRERGDILFSEDGYVSGLHCRIAKGQDGRVYLTDVGSSNGTFIRLSSEQKVSPSDILLMGQQLFRVDF